MPMTELEGIESWSGWGRGRLRGSSLRLGLLDWLGLVPRSLLVVATSTMVSPLASTTSLTITLLLFKGWLIWAAFDRTELVGVLTRGSLSPLPLFPDQGHSSSDLRKVQVHDLFLLAHELGNAIH